MFLNFYHFNYQCNEKIKRLLNSRKAQKRKIEIEVLWLTLIFFSSSTHNRTDGVKNK